MQTHHPTFPEDYARFKTEVEFRGTRGVALLDAVTPGWFRKINPATLKVSDREACVFAQAGHQFEAGIVQVALDGKRMGLAVKLMGTEHHYPYYRATALDVFYYGFDIDETLMALAPKTVWWAAEPAFITSYGERFPERPEEWETSRKEMWAVVEQFWHDVVVEKQTHDAKRTNSPLS